MRVGRVGLPFLAAATALVVAVDGLTPAAKADGDEVTMMRVEPGAGNTQMVNAVKQDAQKWPATLQYLVQNKFNCTSTVIGDRVVITAAHCLPQSGLANIKLFDVSYKLRCTADPRYQSSNLTFDVAMCVIDDSQQTFPNNKFHYENLDLRITHVRLGQNLFLLGYGCRQFPVPGGDPAPQAGALYGGPSPVFDLARQPGGHLITKGGAVICPGDSGGAAYAMRDPDTITEYRSIVGLNSEYIDTVSESFITPLSGDVGEFIVDWMNDNGVSICGVKQGTSNCLSPSYSP